MVIILKKEDLKQLFSSKGRSKMHQFQFILKLSVCNLIKFKLNPNPLIDVSLMELLSIGQKNNYSHI